jgi:hypothetical protein
LSRGRAEGQPSAISRQRGRGERKNRSRVSGLGSKVENWRRKIGTILSFRSRVGGRKIEARSKMVSYLQSAISKNAEGVIPAEAGTQGFNLASGFSNLNLKPATRDCLLFTRRETGVDRRARGNLPKLFDILLDRKNSGLLASHIGKREGFSPDLYRT